MTGIFISLTSLAACLALLTRAASGVFTSRDDVQWLGLSVRYGLPAQQFRTIP